MKKAVNIFLSIALILGCTLCIASNACADIDIQEADHVPWSGYWWPFQSGGLATGKNYRGVPAPLQKYELLTRGTQNGPSVSFYKSKYYDPNAPSWHGLCGYWAQAAAYESIDIFPSSENNVVFRVGDKKGLLTLAHDNNIWIRAEGKHPEVFHEWLMSYIKDQKKCFVADLDPGVEVWSHPIYKYVMNKTVKVDRESITVTIYYASDFVHPDYMGTKVLNQTITYDMFLENGAYTSGEWTGESINTHPDKLTFPILPGTSFESLNYDTILMLARSKDDFLESGEESVSLSSGTYNLILMDRDTYQIDCLAGETVKIDIEKQAGSGFDFDIVITDAIGSIIYNASVDNGTPFLSSFKASLPPYTVRVTQDDYSDPNIYTLSLDILRTYAQSVPYIPKNGMWSGFAVTNPWSYPVGGVMLTAYSDDGTPIQTVFGPKIFQPGEKQTFLFENLGWRKHEYPDIDHLVFSADDAIGHLNMIGAVNPDVATCFVQGSLWGAHLVIPDIISSSSGNKSMIGGITNESFANTDISITLYSSDGFFYGEVNDTIGARENYSIVPGSSPFYTTPENGWVEVTASGDNALVSGYQYINGSRFAESLFALPVESGSKLIPHVPPAGGIWEASATVINPNNSENTLRIHPMKAGEDQGKDLVVTLFPFEKKTIDLVENFGAIQSDPLYHSVLEISGTKPFVGYYTYRPLALQEKVKYPMVNSSGGQSEVVLSHNAGKNGFWWTAACIFNTTMISTTVMVDPYDDSGALIQELKKELTLEPGAYNLLMMRTLFGIANAEKISFVRFRTKETNGRIGGFYMYGATTRKMFSGANM